MSFCIIGCGAMGASMAKKLAQTNQVHLFDTDLKKADKLAEDIKAQSFSDLKSALLDCDFVIVAVKPFDLEQAASRISPLLTKEQIVISVAGGVSLDKLEKLFRKSHIVRAMPSIACAYGKGVIGLVKTDKLSQDTQNKIEKSLSSLGFVLWVGEDKIDGLTTLSGSGPAFAFVIIESMIDAGVAMGLTADMAKQLTLEMWDGALTLMKESGKSPSELKWQVSSPGGITIAGLREMEDSSVRAGIINTLLAAYEKAASD